MINEISKITGYQVTTKYYNGEYRTKEDAERIDKLMTSLERVIDFARKKNYLRDTFEIVFCRIGTKDGTCDFNINGSLTGTNPQRYLISKNKFCKYFLTKFMICKIKSIVCNDIVSKEETKEFTKLITDIALVFPNNIEDLDTIMKFSFIDNDGGESLINSCLLNSYNDSYV